MNSLNTVGFKPTNKIGNIMTQIKYEKIAYHLAMIEQQFTLPQRFLGVVNYQALQIEKIIDLHYLNKSDVKKSFKDWDKNSNDINYKALVSSFNYDYYPLENEEFNNPFANLEDRFFSDEELHKNQHKLSGYN